MVEAPQTPTHVLVDGSLLVVPPEVQLPARCLRCGTRKQVHYHPSTFMEGSNAAGSSGAAGGAVGATFVALGRQSQLFYVLGGVVALFIVGLLLYHSAKSPKVTLELPSCERCTEELAQVRSAWRRWGLIIVGCLGAALVAALMKQLLLIGLTVTALIGALLYTHKQAFADKFIRAQRVQTGWVWLMGVSPKTLDKLAKRAKSTAATEPGPAFEV